MVEEKQIKKPTIEDRIQNVELALIEITKKLERPPISQAVMPLPAQPPSNKLNEMMQNPLMAQLLTQLLGSGTQQDTTKTFFEDLGRRAFYNIFDKAMPTGADVRSGVKNNALE